MPHTQERQFGFMFAAVFLIVAFWPLWPPAAPNPWALAAAAACALGGWLAPRWLAPLYRGWMAFGKALGHVNAMIILTLVFFLLVTPTGLILRLLGQDPLHRRLSRAADYWTARGAALEPESLRNQY